MNEDDRKDLDAAKVKNRETTEAARRALQVARETQEVAEHTLAALDSQNQKIRRLDGKMVEMKEDGEPSPHPRKRIPLRSVDSARPPPPFLHGSHILGRVHSSTAEDWTSRRRPPRPLSER